MIYACDAAKNDLQLGQKNEYVLQMAESWVIIYPSNTLLITQVMCGNWNAGSGSVFCYYGFPTL